MRSILQTQPDHPELTLPELWTTLRRNKWPILGFMAAAGLAAAIVAWLTPFSYKATVTMSPASSSSGSGALGGMGSMLSQLGGLASLAGLSGSADSKKAESVAVLQSEALTEKYIEQNNLLPVLYADVWDRQTGKWTVKDAAHVPTLWKANLYFQKRVRSVTTDPKTGLVTLSITWRDPRVAAKWANDLVTLTNDYLRKKAIDESERDIEYLNLQAAKTDVVPVKQAIYTLLQNEINKAMLARGNQEYAFKILDPAFAPEVPSSPRPKLWIFIALIGSLMLSVFTAFVKLAWWQQ
jgi:uncharacterized protein involved in exopolysaccharide biosynthesis